MHPFTPLLDEACHRTLGRQRFEELDRADEADADALRRKFLDRGTLGPRHAFMKQRRIGEIRDGNSDVIDGEPVQR